MSLRGHKYASVALSGTGNLVDAVAGKRIRLIGYCLSAASESTVSFGSKPAGTVNALSGNIVIAAKGVINDRAGGDDDEGLLQTNVGEALYLTISAAVGGYINYVEV